jgi:hypothetical protein
MDHGGFIMGPQVEQLEAELGRASVLIETHLKFGSASWGRPDGEYTVSEAHQVCWASWNISVSATMRAEWAGRSCARVRKSLIPKRCVPLDVSPPV